MSDRIRCTCQRCSMRSLMGPVVVVTVGVLFLLAEMRGGGGYFDFRNTWPVILIVIGLINLASAFASTEGHVSSEAPVPPAIPPAPGVPPAPAPPASTSYPGQGQ